MTTAPGRRSSTFTRLLRHGFTDPSAAERLLDVPELAPCGPTPCSWRRSARPPTPIWPSSASSGSSRPSPSPASGGTAGHADHGQAAARPAPRRPRRLRGARRPPGPAPARLAGPGHLRGHRPAPRSGGVRAGLAEATDPVSLRVAYRRCLLSIAARDVCGTTDVAETAAELADLATATLRAALGIAQAAAPEDAALCRLAVIAMGKCGGHELNYVSDVDVIFVGEPAEGADESKAMQAATRLASHMMRICSETTVEGYDLARRRQPPPRGPQRPAGAHPHQPPRLLPALGQDLGVPGAAQGPPGRRRPRARRGVRRRRPPWCGRPPTGRTSSPTCRRCAAASSRTSPSPRSTGS